MTWACPFKHCYLFLKIQKMLKFSAALCFLKFLLKLALVARGPYAAVNKFPDTPHREAKWGICFLGVPKTQKSPQPGAHFMSKPPDNPLVKPPPNT